MFDRTVAFKNAFTQLVIPPFLDDVTVRQGWSLPFRDESTGPVG